MELNKRIKENTVITIKKNTPAWHALRAMMKDQKGFAALTQTKVIDTEFSGDYKLLIKTVPVGSASDTLTLVQATDKVTEIAGAWGNIESGLGANFASLQITFSGLVLTVVSTNAAGSNSTSWGTVRLFIIARGNK